MKKTKLLLIYLILLLPSYLISSFLWQILIYNKLYYCSDPVLIFNLIPPFVHGVGTGDKLFIDQYLLYLVWIVFVILFFSLPVIVIKLYKRNKDK